MPSSSLYTPLVFAAFIACPFFSPSAAASDTRPLEFNRDIRPILSDRCFQCHGPDEKKREAGLRLDLPESATEDLGGYFAILPHDPADSELMLRVTSEDPDMKMPPSESGKTLSADEIALLRRWISEGAVFEKHWSFSALVKPEAGATKNQQWPRSEIDRFILAELESWQLNPAPEADRATLIKRLSLDLTGLLPSPEEVDLFVSDTSPNAYEQLVDRLLRSKHFGERFARHWLDLARYADSNGYANDGLRSIWPYRDWVIAALNDDMPFDQFTIEQLAGDLLPNPTKQQLVATGFHRNTPLQTEGGSDPEQYRVERTKNRTDTTGAVWFGLTVGCAQCHTHKFDPITHAEYYQLYAFFNSVDEPSLSLPTPEQEEALANVDQQIVATQQAIQNRETLAQNVQQEVQSQWMPIEIDRFESEQGATLSRLDDGSILSTGPNPSIDTYVLEGEFPQPTRVLQLAALTHDSLPGGGPGRAGNGNFVLAQFIIAVNGQPVSIHRTAADHAQSGYPISDAIDGDSRTGWAINVPNGSLHQNRHAFFEFDRPQIGRFEIRLRSYDQGNGYNIGRLRLSANSDNRLMETMVAVEDALQVKLRDLQQQKKRLQSQVAASLVMRQRSSPRKSYVQLAGDFLDPGPEVTPAPLSVLHPWAPPADRQPNRLDLAEWIIDPANPLTARVQANRIWQQMFGVGLVETENDFGYQGSLPSHPKLLDYLATELIEGQWRQKRIYKMIAMSATYRQASIIKQASSENAQLAAIDPMNRLLSRQSRYRVEAELVRDIALCASGLRSPKIGGPSVFPPIPAGVIGTSSAKHRWPESQGEDRFRRGMYTAVYRANEYPMLATFDGPDRDNACTRRGTSNTPLQSLTLANDLSMVEMAVYFAKRILEHADLQDTDARTRYAVKVALCRDASDEEARRIGQFYADRLSFYQQNELESVALSGEPNPELAAWIATARVIMNLDEFITRE